MLSETAQNPKPQNPLTMRMNDEVTICIRYLLITLATLITQGHQHDRANLLRVDCLRSGRRSLVPPPVAASLAGRLKTWTQSLRLSRMLGLHLRSMSGCGVPPYTYQLLRAALRMLCLPSHGHPVEQLAIYQWRRLRSLRSQP